MWKPYLKVIAKKAVNAVNILDRFHIMKMFNDAIDKIRRQETAQLMREGYEPVLKNSRWLIAKRPENLTDKQRPRLKELLQYNLKSVRAYLLREDFQQFWEYVSPVWAMKFLDGWIKKTMRSRIEPMKKVAKTLRRHQGLILNWFFTKRQYSCGIVEAINSSAKMTIRTAHGFRRFETMEYALFHRLGELPLPETTHNFSEEAQIITGTDFRLDSTVCECNIHYPTDSSLLWDCYRVVSRNLRMILKACPEHSKDFRFHEKKIKQLHTLISTRSSSKKKSTQRKIKKSVQ